MELFDDYGYPSDESLEKVINWKVENDNDFHDIMSFCKKLWYYPDYFRKDGDVYRLATGGWSGNEDVIRAMQANHMFWIFYWDLSQRGGYYIFCPIRTRYHEEIG